MRSLSHLAFAFALAMPQCLLAQQVLKDINALAYAGELDADPEWFVADGTTWTYFSARSVVEGVELWRTDGTVVELVADIHPTGSSNPTQLSWSGTHLVFFANAPGGAGLHAYDPVADAVAFLAPFSEIFVPTAMGGSLYFFADAGDGSGCELWRTDGSAAGTILVKDIRPGLADSRVAMPEMIALGSEVFFNADDGSNSIELWKSDGTAAGTVMVKDIALGSIGSSPAGFAVLDGYLYFHAYEVASGTELWRSDGTAVGTTLVRDIRPGSLGSDIRMLGTQSGRLLFWADGDGVGLDVWASDGSYARTFQIAFINAQNTPDPDPGFASMGSTAMFLVKLPSTYNNLELWQSDGTPTGTSEVINFGGGTDIPRPYRIESAGDRVLFVGPTLVYDPWFGTTTLGDWQIWSCDGTAAGTQRLLDIVPPASTTSMAVTPDGSRLLFAATDFVRGSEPWISDGTEAGTRLVAEVCVSPTGRTHPASPSALVDAFGRAFLVADDGLHGESLWSSDGTAAGTQLVWAGEDPEAVEIAELVPFGDKLLMACEDPEPWDSLGIELFISDGRAEGTQLVKDLRPGVSGSSPSDFVVFGDQALFWADHSSFGREPWVTDGTAEGTVFLKDIVIGGASIPRELIRFEDRAFIAINDKVHGEELWVTDGTTAGTQLFLDIRSGYSAGSPRFLTVFDGKLYFAATTSAAGRELWVSDGTVAGTSLLTDIWPGSSSSSPQYLTVAGRKLFFWASDHRGQELWVSDGTAAGTQQVKDIRLTGDSPARALGAVGDRVFFLAWTQAEGEELWVSDGSAAGTYLVKDIRTGSYGSFPSQFVATGHRKVYFVANDGLSGEEVWQSDGTAAGTLQLADVRPGALRSVVGDCEMTLVNGKLLWVADDGIKGSEVRVHDPGASSKEIGRGSGLTEPRLMTSGAVIGGIWELSVASEIPSSFGYLALSPPATPTSLFMPNFLAQDNQIYLDLLMASTMPLIPVGTDVNGDWSLSVSIPGGMSSTAALAVQGVLINGGKWDLTNAVHFTIGH